jgi:hypothetical protein
MLRLKSLGWGVRRIAKELGCSHMTVRRMWSEITRAQYRRDDLRYASDVSDREWELIEALLPPTKRLGDRGPRDCARWSTPCFTSLTIGCQWRQLPKEHE